jgi:hypothetical protein
MTWTIGDKVIALPENLGKLAKVLSMKILALHV